MTTARIASAPAEGHGLTSSLCDELYARLQKGEPTGQLVVVALLDPVGTSQRKTAKGTHRSVTFEALRIEAVDGAQSDEIRELLTSRYETRTGRSDQLTLAGLGLADLEADEQQKALIERVEAWADEQKLGDKEIDERWRDLLGAGDNAAPSYRKGSTQHLLQFLHSVGVVADTDDAPPDTAADES